MKSFENEVFRKRNTHGHTLFMRLLDKVVLTVGVIGPLMTIPQILKIYILQDATGVSVLSWGAYALLDIPWILYGLLHGVRPILVTYSLWVIMNCLVVSGALMYGAGLY